MANLHLVDVAKRSGNDPAVPLIESMAQSNALLQRLPFKSIVGNNYKVKKRTGLGAAVTRMYNEGITPTKSLVEDYIYTTYLYNDRSTVDVDLADNAPEGAVALRQEEDISHLAAISNLFNYHCFYGNNQTSQTQPDGIATILSSTAFSTVKAGTGASGSSTSIYFVSFRDAVTQQGIMKGVQGVVTSGKELSAEDMGKVYFPDADGTKQLQWYTTEFKAQYGFAIYDTRSVGRYMGLTSTIAPSTTNMDAIITAMLPFQADAIFVNKTGLNLIKGLKSTITYLPAEREIKLSPASYDGIPVFLDENISDTE